MEDFTKKVYTTPMEERFLPIGIQDFEKLRKGGYVYVDKTKYVYELARLSTPFFLSRPRRFGKSLLLSTFEAFFLGKKELFDGLYISEKEKEWAEWPVIKISFGGDNYPDLESLKSTLNFALSSNARAGVYTGGNQFTEEACLWMKKRMEIVGFGKKLICA